ncbi:Photoactivated adenylate cyclase subunit beta [Fibrella aestuarina BUZ 2]|uniref:Photoactivated adenylate cyclase subunit beta n=1 Tax=Fibrella aestuarina BUZ 2 TaxID=1166018 RepID=I0KAE1_9BACT|nr:BLUF domain-containing protein [Fibrella aestuarina]CCH01094.1 Photoactivated adenylate cyclase subunit beta [Fibrella aestuarina BUZ 2]
MDYCITYFSSAAESTTEHDIVDIVEFSRIKNARLNITGVLLYINGSIVQVLEGPQAALEDLYKSIQADVRHTNVRAVISQPISQRLFSHWYMGYETLSVQQYEEVQNIIPVEPQAQPFSDDEQPVIVRMLKDFFDLNSRKATH